MRVCFACCFRPLQRRGAAEGEDVQMRVSSGKGENGERGMWRPSEERRCGEAQETDRRKRRRETEEGKDENEKRKTREKRKKR